MLAAVVAPLLRRAAHRSSMPLASGDDEDTAVSRAGVALDARQLAFALQAGEVDDVSHTTLLKGPLAVVDVCVLLGFALSTTMLSISGGESVGMSDLLLHTRTHSFHTPTNLHQRYK